MNYSADESFRLIVDTIPGLVAIMISLEGLTLATGRIQEAGYILRTFAKYLKDGLIPNMSH